VAGEFAVSVDHIGQPTATEGRTQIVKLEGGVAVEGEGKLSELVSFEVAIAPFFIPLLDIVIILSGH